MADDRERRDDASAPYRRSGSGREYDPDGNWAAERRLGHPSPGATPGMEGAPSGAGYGGFGPEGDHSGPAGEPNADVLGQVNAEPDEPEGKP